MKTKRVVVKKHSDVEQRVDALLNQKRFEDCRLAVFVGKDEHFLCFVSNDEIPQFAIDRKEAWE